MAHVRVVPWVYRDGTVNLEVRSATFGPQDGTTGPLVTHVQLDRTLGGALQTLCGATYRYYGPMGNGLQRSGSIDCPECRLLLSACTFTCEVGVHSASRKEV